MNAAPRITIRTAVAADIPPLRELIALSVRGLMTTDYPSSQLESALGVLLGVDSQLIADGTYFIAEAELADGSLATVGCGGWSKRKTLYGADRRADREDAFLDPAIDPAKIRAFFIHPAWARRGIGSRILETCENAAHAEGFTRFEMGATLSGIPLYEARGYQFIERIEAPLPNGETLAVVRMAKLARSLE